MEFEKCYEYCNRITNIFVYGLAFSSTISLIVLTILMDYKECINTPINTTHIFASPETRG